MKFTAVGIQFDNDKEYDEIVAIARSFYNKKLTKTRQKKKYVKKLFNDALRNYIKEIGECVSLFMA